MLKVYWITLFFCLIILPGFATHSIEEVDSLHELSYPLLDDYRDSAYSIAEQALEVAKEINYDFGVANSYYIMGYIHHQEDEATKGVFYYLNASQLLKKKDDFRSMHNHAEILMNTGNILKKYQKYHEAHQFMDEAMNLINRIPKGDSMVQKMQILYGKAQVFVQEEEYDLAQEVLEESIPRTRELGFNYQHFNSLNLMGLIYHYQKDFDNAKKYYQLMLDTGHPSHHHKGLALHNIAEIYYDQGMYDSAEVYYWECLKEKKLEQKRPMQENIFFVYRDLSKMYLKTGRYFKSIEAGLASMRYFEKALTEPDNYVVFEYLSEAYHNIGKSDSSHYYSDRFFQENEKYQKRQEELMKIRDEFKIDVFLEEYYSQQDDYPASFYQTSIGILLLGFLILILYQLKIKLQSK